MADPWVVVKSEPASDPWAVISSAPSPNPMGLANRALAGTPLANTIAPPKPPQVDMQEASPLSRFATAAASTAGDFAKSVPQMLPHNEQGDNPDDLRPTFTKDWQAVSGIPKAAYDMIAGSAKRIGGGDVAGGLGEATTNAAIQYALGKSGTKQVKSVPAGITNTMNEARASSVRAAIPEASHLPTPAIVGTENIFRAAAPTGGNPGFRDSLYTAAGDLAEVGRKLDLHGAKGGTIAPDMRVRATIDALDSHLGEMYNTERGPQIARHGDAQVQLGLGEDAANGLDFLSRGAGKAADRSIASSATASSTISLSHADQLAKLVNQELRKYESMTPEGQAQLLATNPKIGGLKDLDRSLSDVINGELNRRGEPGLQNYERRYATVSSIRDQLQSRMNAVELQRNIPGANLARGVFGGRHGIASASQAAVANVNIGSELAKGFKSLAETDLTANRGATVGPVPQRWEIPAQRQLTAGATQLPSSMEPIGTSLRPPATAAATREIRKGLLLPDRNPFDLPSSMDPIGAPGSPQPQLPYQPSAQNPRQFVYPGEIKPSPVEGNLFRDLLPQPAGPLFDLLVKRGKKKR